MASKQSGKQLKIALSDELFKKLSQEAKKRNIPVSTYARALMTGQLEAEPSESEIPARDLILLSDVLSNGNTGAEVSGDVSGKSPESKKTSGVNGVIEGSNGQPINIQITINK
jgi:hypoxanthine-guanine phosphoribosyltransferase